MNAPLSEAVRVGLIGCGRIADLHVPGYADLAGRARIAAVCDADRETAERRRAEWGAEKAYTDYRELLSDAGIDAVEILTPHRLHEEMTVAALEAGKHVAVQKPMTIDLASADRMLAASARHPELVFRVTDNYAFYPPIVRAREMIRRGDIGEPLTLRIKFIGGGSGGWEVPASAWQWRMQEAAEGRGLQTFDHGHHLWTTGWLLFGSVERVAGWIDSLDGVTDSPAVLVWKCKDARRYGLCEFAHAEGLHIPGRYYANDEWIEITGSHGILFIHRCTGEIHTGPAMSLYDGKQMHAITDVDSDWAAGFRGATQNFIEAIEGRAAPMLSGAEGREVLAFTMAVAKASRVHREVFPEELDRKFPNWYARRRIRRERKADALPREGWLTRLGLVGGYGKYAPRARELTEQLLERFDAAEAGDWETVIALRLTAEGGVPEQRFLLRVKDGRPQLILAEAGAPAGEALMTATVPAGVWAAILSGNKRIETAVLQGKLKLEGRAEEGLKLRAVFHL